MTSLPELLAEVEPEEDELLRSRERPIVIVKRRAGAPVADAVAPGVPWLGVMLPYTRSTTSSRRTSAEHSC